MVIHGGYFCPTVPDLPLAGGHTRTLIRNVLYLDKQLIIARRAPSGIQYFRTDRVRICVPT